MKIEIFDFFPLSRLLFSGTPCRFHTDYENSETYSNEHVAAPAVIRRGRFHREIDFRRMIRKEVIRFFFE